MPPSIKALRANYKQRREKHLYALTRTDAWQLFKQRAGLEAFDFVIGQPHHFDDVLKLCLETFSTSSPWPSLFGFRLSSENTPALFRQFSESFRFWLEIG